ncbi:unnamed protein product [Meloidogyne enterolobii]|uniref:Uncharacterized protein n=1 Tax=Meloidogyne enterolobii TaxID=390850 RepID=A0ACB1AI42_MELEN
MLECQPFLCLGDVTKLSFWLLTLLLERLLVTVASPCSEISRMLLQSQNFGVGLAK